jgi:adenylosuccinate lyase
MSKQFFNPLNSISPLDGRYYQQIRGLSSYFSEFSFIRYRIFTELKYYEFIRRVISGSDLIDKTKSKLQSIYDLFDESEAEKVKTIEAETRHDVKAVEYYLRNKFAETDIEFPEYIHFGLTSEDINSVAYGLMLSDAKNNLVIPEINSVINELCGLAEKYRSAVMPGRTHGQFAVPTTFGKEMAVFANRIHTEKINLAGLKIEAKLGGAVGNFSSLTFAYPDKDWIKLSDKFISELGLQPNHVTTQIINSDSYTRLFHGMEIINSVLTGFVQDMWRYTSDGYLNQKAVSSETGSSTMPQKVNPIDFENAEGNLGMANAIFAFFSEKLSVSRLQRDLSDSTVKRNFGTAFGHSILAYKSIFTGLSRVEVNTDFLSGLTGLHWECITEGLQTVLRTAGDKNAYERLKVFARGNNITEADVRQFIDSLEVSSNTKNKLKQITPLNYVGLAADIVNETTGKIRNT